MLYWTEAAALPTVLLVWSTRSTGRFVALLIGVNEEFVLLRIPNVTRAFLISPQT